MSCQSAPARMCGCPCYFPLCLSSCQFVVFNELPLCCGV
ncbi:unnamed protein product, partial [Staurois parvus]